MGGTTLILKEPKNFKVWLFLAFVFCLVIASIVWILRPPAITDGLVAYYPFNGNANDESGSGYNGIVFGATLAPDRFGSAESAYHFNGRSDYIQTSIAASRFANDFTIAVWVNFSNFENSYPEILCGDNYFIVFHGMGPVYQGQKNHISFYQQTGIDHKQSTRIGSLVSANALQVNRWHLIAITKNDLHFSMFIDDVLQAESVSEYSIQLTGSSLYIGANIPGGGRSTGYIDGFIDDIRIYNRALSESEIRILFREDGWKSDE